MKFVGGITYGPNTFTFPQTFSGQVTLTNASGYNLYASGTADNYMAGKLGVGTLPNTFSTAVIGGSLTGQTTNEALTISSTSATGVTSSARGVQSRVAPAASAAVTSLYQFYANPQAFGSGGSATNQYGFHAESTITGATNNYAFTGAIPAGTGRYNLYMGGTADNYMAGNLGIGAVPSAGVIFDITKAQTGASIAFTVSARINPDATVTSAGYGFSSFALNAVGTSTPTIYHYNASQGTFAGTAPTNQLGFNVNSILTGATNNYGYYGNIAAGTGRYNLYMNGTADNYMAGSLGIGAVPVSDTVLYIAKSPTGSTVAKFAAVSINPDSTVTSICYGFLTYAINGVGVNTQFIYHYSAVQGVYSGTAPVTQQGYRVDSNLVGATNNSAFSGSIPAGTGRYNLYMGGTADNYLAGSLTVANSITISGAFALRGSYGAGAITSNFAAGDNALVSNTTGTSNSAVGVSALQFNTTGTNNSSMGAYALQFNTTGTNNSAIGARALLSNTTGAYNTAIGPNALQSNTTGVNNSAIGPNALQSNTTGTGNSAVGVNALQDLATTTIVATAIVNGTAYQIVTMGTTTSAQWIASGAVTGTVGETFTANATAGVGTGTVATSANIATQCLNNTVLGKSSGRGITTGSGNTILGANVTGLAAGLTNNVIIANGTGSIRVQSNATTITFADVILPPQAATASAPAYVKGGMYFDTTLNKMRIGGATAWETVTSV